MSADALSVSEVGLTLREAADQLGVSTTILRKLIRGGNVPEAEKVKTPEGRVWCIPREGLQSIATREGWVIDLRTDDAIGVTEPSEEEAADQPDAEEAITEHPTSEQAAADTPTDRAPNQTDLVAAATEQSLTPDAAVLDGPPQLSEVLDLALLDRLLGAKEEAVEMRVHSERNLQELENVMASRRELAEELSATRDRLSRTSEQYQLEQGARAVAEAQVSELRDRVSREAELAEVERAGRAEAAATALVREREAARAAASLGWWSRRKYRRLQRMEEGFGSTTPNIPGPSVISVPLERETPVPPPVASRPPRPESPASTGADHSQSLRQPLFGRSSPPPAS